MVNRRTALKSLVAGGIYWTLPIKPALADERFMRFGPETRYIPQWQRFFIEHPELVATRIERVNLRAADWAKLRQIVRAQNHEYVSDGINDDWRLLEDGEPGDCEDLALTLLRDLVADGFPLNAIQPIAAEWNGKGHMALRLTVGDGDYIICPQQKEIVRWTELSWQWRSCHASGSEWLLYSGGDA